MDSHSMREEDRGNDSGSLDTNPNPNPNPPPSSSTHRMPTVSAAQALDELDDDLRQTQTQSPSPGKTNGRGVSSNSNRKYRRWISTGVEGLDRALLVGRWEVESEPVTRVGADGDDEGEGDSDGLGRDKLAYATATVTGGVERGKVTEVYGPPGVGKTALGIQLAANALRAGYKVIWIDAGHTLPGPRLEQMLISDLSSEEPDRNEVPEIKTVSDLLSNLLHFTTPTLPHLIALLRHASPTFPPAETALLVLDSLSTIMTISYPRGFDNAATPGKSGTIAANQESHQWATMRKWSVLQYLISTLQKLAALHNIAVVVLNQTATKMHPGSSAVLVPAITSTAWDAGISARIVLFRDWACKGKEVRLAGVVKGDGGAQQRLDGQVGDRAQKKRKIVAFSIQEGGLKESPLPDRTAFPHPTNMHISPQHRIRKRKADEIQDSEEENEDDEDYGWAEDDEEHLPALPPQWQGSEDLLVLPERDGEVEDDDGDGDGDEVEERGEGRERRRKELWSESSALDSEGTYYWAAGGGGEALGDADENGHGHARYEFDDGHV